MRTISNLQAGSKQVATFGANDLTAAVVEFGYEMNTWGRLINYTNNMQGSKKKIKKEANEKRQTQKKGKEKRW